MNSGFPAISRRQALQLGLTSTLGLTLSRTANAAAVKPKSVAAVITVYRHNSHADVILTKILEGWKHDGGPGPALKLASIYIDQHKTSEFGLALCKKHGVPIFDSIEKAITVGGKSIPVDGVLSIGEHGNYPHNKLGQHLYPRRRFFEEITAAFEKHGRVVPVFNDKHLSTVWEDGKWMYDRAKKLQVPLMAGSSLPLTYRNHPLDLAPGCDLESAIGLGYSDLDAYGFHAIESYQSVVERRKSAETGVKWVQFLEGPAVWKAVDAGQANGELLALLYDRILKGKSSPLREDKLPQLFLFEYQDGFKGGVFMLANAHVGGVAVKAKGQEPLAAAFEERAEPRFPHFAFLTKAIEQMMHTGKPPYPVERTLLTAGILDRGLHSKFEGGKRVMTPELAIAYQPVDYPHAPKPDLLSPPATTN